MSDELREGLGFRELTRRILQARAEGESGARGRRIDVVRAPGSTVAVLAVSLAREKVPVVYVAADAAQAALAASDVAALAAATNGVRSALLPASELSPYEPVRPDHRLLTWRAATLGALARGDLDIVVTSAHGWMRKTTPPGQLRNAMLSLRVGDEIDLERLARDLDLRDYQRSALVEDPGSFAVRGSLLDLWPVGLERPVRVELDFDRVARLRTMDPESQRSGTELPSGEFWVSPAREVLSIEAVARGVGSASVGAAGVESDRADAAAAAEVEARMRRTLQELCDAVQLPSKKARALIEEAVTGRSFLLGDAFWPARYELVPLSAYLAPETVVLVEDAPRVALALTDYEARIEQSFEAAEGPRFPPAAHFVLGGELDGSFVQHTVVTTQPTQVLGGTAQGYAGLGIVGDEPLVLGALDQAPLSTAIESARKSGGLVEGLAPLWRTLSEKLEAGYLVVLAARTASRGDRLAELATHHGFSVERREGDLFASGLSVGERGSSGALVVTHLPLSRGFELPIAPFFVLTEEEIFGGKARAHREPKRATSAAFVDDLRSLELGDYVVHAEHGIGRYQGLLHQVVDGRAVDLIAVEYASGDRLLLPVYRLSLLQRYSGAEAEPRLDKLGGHTFEKTKSAVRKEVRQLADQLLRLYAERRALKRPPLPVPADELAAFEAAFPYDETPDQAAAIHDVISDLTNETVMDRLVCGDVGFGKTEVALRAAYLNVLDGRQVALLCPTTVLAEQHHRTFGARLEPLGVKVRVVSRFQSKKTVDRTLAELKAGKVDVLIGTHRLLSKDVHFQALGLLVVDEEQRFGVAHKERLKELRRTVDVLTLSATPIPRTLSLSIGGLRDISVIGTPPQDRRSVRTLTSRFDDQVIFGAIDREVKRGGQVFFVVPKVLGIEARAAYLKSLLPGVRIGVAHGQMSESALERTMQDFVLGDFDVLLSTTIIESGLDIPRANTLLIERADLFGLSQLHQLRGRVGRSAVRAYCYLLLPEDAEVTDEARRRIEALERYTELGSGFHLATLDMELRGAGEVLGADQSGLMPRVGYELFARMLEEATAELSGIPYQPDIDPEVAVDVEALLPEDYVEDIGVRLGLYKRFAAAPHESDVLRLAEEMEDRFGTPPGEVRRFVAVMRLKADLRQLRALSCNATRRTVTIHLSPDTPLLGAVLAPFITGQAGTFTLTPDGRLTRRAKPKEEFESGLLHAQRLLEELRVLLPQAPR